MFRCKLCGHEAHSSVDYANHFFLRHKVSAKSLFSCGVQNCSAQFYTASRYDRHISDFHSSPHPKKTLEQADAGEDSPFKCEYPGCSYVTQNKITLRSHRFRKHKDEPLPSGSKSALLTKSSGEQHEPCSPSGEFSEHADFHESIIVEGSGVHIDLKSSEDNLTQDFIQFFLTLASQNHVPDSTAQLIIEKYSVLLKESQKILKQHLLLELSDQVLDKERLHSSIDKVLKNDLSIKLHDADGPMRSRFMRQKHYANHPNYVAPIGYHLGWNQNNISRYHHYVPIRATLTNLFKDESVLKQYEQRQTNSDCLRSGYYMVDFQDGSRFKNTDPSVIQLILYQDDVEIVNPLGSGKGKHKLNMYFYTLGNLHSWNRSKINPIQLVMITREVDVSYFGLEKVLKPLIDELKSLEQDGLEIQGKKVKVALMVLLGDNLGTHTVGGFVENFGTSHFFCRYCEESREQWQQRWCGGGNSDGQIGQEEDSNSDDSEENDSADPDSNSECSSTGGNECSGVGVSSQVPSSSTFPVRRQSFNASLRTKESYDRCVAAVEGTPEKYRSGLKGVVANCQFNALNSFHIVTGSPPCVGHDLFSGVVDYDVYIALTSLEKNFKLQKDVINKKVMTFPFTGEDAPNKPSRIPLKGRRLSGHAVQNWTFTRFLPLLIGNRVPDKTHPAWRMILLLIKILQLVLSPCISNAMLTDLDSMIKEYLHVRSRYFGERLRPKHHFFEHYVMLTIMYGPLQRSSTLRFESKFTFFRNVVRSGRNFRNITQILAKRHQQFQSALAANNIFTDNPILVEEMPHGLEQSRHQVCELVSKTFGKEALLSMSYARKVSFRGTEFAIGRHLIISSKRKQIIQVCKIELLLATSTSVYAIGIYLHLSNVLLQQMRNLPV